MAWGILGPPSEALRRRLLAEELKLRKKQPEHWAKTKYRKFARPFSAVQEAAGEEKKLKSSAAKKRKKAGRKRAGKLKSRLGKKKGTKKAMKRKLKKAARKKKR